MKTNRVLFCTDLTDESQAAGQLALEYADNLQAELLIVHVIDGWERIPNYVRDTCFNYEDYVRRSQASVQERLDLIAAELGKRAPAIRTIVKMGRPADEILKLAKKESVKLIVMGTHGRGGFQHVLLGSVAEGVVRMATCPVLIIRSSLEKAA